MTVIAHRSAVNTNDMLGLLMRDLDRYPMPNYDEQVELAKRVTAGDEEAKKQMVAANLRLVLHWARRYQDRGVEMVDLVQEGTFGLLRAVEKFDWERGFKFSTYAHMEPTSTTTSDGLEELIGEKLILISSTGTGESTRHPPRRPAVPRWFDRPRLPQPQPQLRRRGDATSIQGRRHVSARVLEWALTSRATQSATIAPSRSSATFTTERNS